MSDLFLTPEQFCDKFSVCREGREFALKYQTMAEVWDNCPKLGWLQWISTKLDADVTYSTSRLFACWCVRNTPIPDGRTTWDLLSDSRSRDAVVAAEGFVAGTVTVGQMTIAASAGFAAARAFYDMEAMHGSFCNYYAANAAARVAASYSKGFDVDTTIRTVVYAAAMTIPGTLDVALEASNAAQLAQFRRMIPNPFDPESKTSDYCRSINAATIL